MCYSNLSEKSGSRTINSLFHTLKRYENIIGPAFALLVILALCLPNMIYGVDNKYDMRFHLTWFLSVQEQIAQGVLYPRWLPDQMYGMGSPAFFFYPPFATYFFVAMDFLSFKSLPPENLMAVSIFIMTVLSGLSFHVWIKNFTGKYIAFAASFFYAVAPYHFAIDYHNRGAVAEFTAFLWIPLIFAGTYRLMLNPDRKWILFLAASMAGLFFTHLLTALLIGPVVALYALTLLNGYDLKTTSKKLGVLIFAGLTGMGLAAIYYVPALALFDEINNAALHQWPLEDSFLYGAFSETAKDQRSLARLFPIATVYLVVAFLIIFKIISDKIKAVTTPHRNQLLLWSGLACFIYLILNGVFSFIFSKPSSPYYQIQFVWRSITPMEFIMLSGAAILIQNASSDSVGKFVKEACLVLLTGLFLLQVYHVSNKARGMAKRGSIMATDTIEYRLSPTEYFPQGTNFTNDDMVKRLQEYGDGPTAKIIKGQGRIENITQTPKGLRIDYNAKTPLSFTVNDFYFPGWEAQEQDSKNVIVTPEGKDKILSLTGPSGEHSILLKRVQTKPETTGQIISMFSLLILLLCSFIPFRLSPITNK